MPGMVLVFGVIISLVVAFILIARHIEKRRQADLQALADSMGLTYIPDDGGQLLERHSPLAMFQQGHGRKVFNCLTGDSGEVEISIFDYRFTTGSGKHQHTQTWTVCSLQSPRLRLPQFSMRPENLLDAIGSALGFQDIDFEEDDAFSRSYVLKGADVPAIRKLFHAPLRQHFTEARGAYAEGAGNRLAFHWGKRAKPAQYADLLKQAYAVFGHVVDR